MSIKIAHFLNFAPHAAGIYETAKEMILAERKAGIDAQAIDYGNGQNAPQRHSRVWCKDGDIETVSPQWAVDEADIIVRHSAIPQKVLDTHKPVIMVLHGTPEYTFLLEHTGKTRVLKEILVSAENPDYKMFVTFWKENIFPWQVWLPGRKISYVPSFVDLEFFNPKKKEKEKDYKFQKPGDFNIVVTNVWRKEYVTPFSALFAAAKWVKTKHPQARIHVFGVPGDDPKYPKNDGPMNRTLLALQKANCVSSCFRIIPNLNEIYRAADMMVTPHVVASRTVREALASGCPVVAGAGNPYTPYQADPRSIDSFVRAIEQCYQDIKVNRDGLRIGARGMAEKEFNFDQVGQAMKKIFEGVLNNG